MKTAPLSMYSYRFVHVLAAFVVLAALAVTGARPAQASECPVLLRHSFPDLRTGEPQDLCQYRGRVILVVNTASYCGFTDQYGGLEALYRKYRDRGLVVLGFPSNDFAGQEPGSNSQIANFCRLTYGVQFPMFAKSRVVGGQPQRVVRGVGPAHGRNAALEFPQVPDRPGRHPGAELRFRGVAGGRSPEAVPVPVAGRAQEPEARDLTDTG
jgi:glutathione peroxidase